MDERELSALLSVVQATKVSDINCTRETVSVSILHFKALYTPSAVMALFHSRKAKV